MTCAILKFLVIGGYFLSWSYGKSVFPDYIQLCARSDPNLIQCALESSKKAIPHIINGDKTLGVPNMNPLVLPHVQLESSKNLQLGFDNLEVRGLANAEAVDFIYDFKNRHMMGSINVEKIVLKGPYTIDGQILVLPIKGNGFAAMTIHGGNYNYSIDYELFDKNNSKYAKVIKDDIKFTVRKAEFSFDNLFNGDKRLGDEMNKFLNENWEDIVIEFGPIIGRTIANVCRKLADEMFENVPFDDIWLD